MQPGSWRTCGALPGIIWKRSRAAGAGQYSIRINERWRICFRWRDGEAHEVEIIDYH